MLSYASGSSSSGGSSLFFPLLMAAALLFFWLLIVRPQQKRRKDAEAQQKAVDVGDEIVTIGGLYGVIVEMDDESVFLEIDEGVHARYARQAIGRVVNRASEAATSDVDDEPALAVDEPESEPVLDDEAVPTDGAAHTNGVVHTDTPVREPDEAR